MTGGCLCQQSGKTAVPNDRGYCLVCGVRVDFEEPLAGPCPVYRPDHNGECLLCDEWADAHTPEAIARGYQLAAERTEQERKP
jgi:hypothetical protein